MQALATAEQAATIFKEIKDRRGEATALLLAANVYKSVGEFDEAIFNGLRRRVSGWQAEKWLQEAQEIFENLGERRL